MRIYCPQVLQGGKGHKSNATETAIKSESILLSRLWGQKQLLGAGWSALGFFPCWCGLTQALGVEESTAPQAQAEGAIARAAVPALWGDTAPAIPAAALKNTDSLWLNALCLFSWVYSLFTPCFSSWNGKVVPCSKTEVNRAAKKCTCASWKAPSHHPWKKAVFQL